MREGRRTLRSLSRDPLQGDEGATRRRRSWASGGWVGLWAVSVAFFLAACSGLDGSPLGPAVDPADVVETELGEVEAAPAVVDAAASVPNVSSVDELRAALLDPEVGVIVLAAGTYAIDDPTLALPNYALHVGRSVVIRAADGLSGDEVVIDAAPAAEGVWSRVMTVAPGAGGSVVLQGLTIRNGFPVPADGGGGGGVLHTSGSLELRDVVVADNRVGFFDSQARGGGIYSTGARLTVVDSLISGNSAPGGNAGGLYFASDGSRLLISGSTFTGNAGGALRLRAAGGNCDAAGAATMTIVNSTIADNPGPAHAVYVERGAVDLYFATIAGNEGEYGLFLDPSVELIALSPPENRTCARVGHSIIAGNADRDIYADFLFGISVRSYGYNLVGRSSFHLGFATDGTSIDLGSGDLRLEALGDHGGPTLTMPPAFDSPARNAGVPLEGWDAYWAGISLRPAAEIIASLLSDQRGLPRPHGLRADMGAVERLSTSPAIEAALIGPAWATMPVSVEATLPAPSGEAAPEGMIGFTFAEQGCEAELEPAGDWSVAVCAITFPTPGRHEVGLTYEGSVDHAASSAVLEVDVLSAPTIVMRPDPDPAVPGEPVALGFEVSYHDGSPASGRLAVLLAGEEIAGGDLVDGRLSTTPLILLAAVHELQARYDSTLNAAPQIVRTFQLDLAGSSRLVLGLGPLNPASPVLGPASQATVIAQVTVGAPQGTLRLEMLKLALSGHLPGGAAPGLDVASLGTLRLHLDLSGDGALDAGDVELGRATVMGAGLLELVLAEPLDVGAGQVVRLLLLASPADAVAGWVPVVVVGSWGVLALLGFSLAGGRRRLGRLPGLVLLVALPLILTACPGQDAGPTAAIVVDLQLIGAEAGHPASGDTIIASGSPVTLPSVTMRADP